MYEEEPAPHDARRHDSSQHRHDLDEARKLEAGLSLRVPIGAPFREFTGIPLERTTRTIYGSDFGGEMLVRLVSLYLRGSF